MIDRVHFENFKSLADVTIDLGRFTVLVGPNGCGKSSVLQAMRLHAAAAIWPDDVGRYAFDGDKNLMLSARWSSTQDEVVVHVSLPEEQFRLEIRGPGGSKQAVFGGSPVPVPEEFRKLFEDPRRQAFESCIYLRPDAGRMWQTTVPHVAVPTMDDDGYGLASVLAWMKGAAEDELAVLTQQLAQIVPGVKRIRTLREQVVEKESELITIDGQAIWRPVERHRLGDRFELEFENGRSIPADLLSEGTVLALGLLTKLREKGRPRLVLLDDIDRGLHLVAQAALVAVLRRVLDAQPDLQIVCTTHSPYLLDLFAPEEVRVMAIDAERRTHVRALSDHPDIEKWKIGTQTGELWATLGESWVLEAGGG